MLILVERALLILEGICLQLSGSLVGGLGEFSLQARWVWGPEHMTLNFLPLFIFFIFFFLIVPHSYMLPSSGPGTGRLKCLNIHFQGNST